MLQIISGKYFENGKSINSQLEYEVLYSNFHCFMPIITEYFEIIPINSYPERINQFVIKFENRYQPRDDKDILFLASHDPVVHQIKYLLTFYFDCFFHKDKNVVSSYVSNQDNPNVRDNIASVHLPHIFSVKKLNTKFDVEGFIEFVDMILSLNRKSYKLVIRYLSAYYHALEAFETNYEISYTTFIYLLEALVLDVNVYNPVWDDYEQNKKCKLEKVFIDIEDEKVESIKEILLKDNNLKLKRKFVNGLFEYTKDEYYLNKNEMQSRHILKSEMHHVLNNLYQIRSKYVHKLDSLETIVKTHGFDKTNVIYDFEDPKFSIFGLSIFVKHIINNFINNPLEDDNDEFNWRDELPGIITAKLAPQYWIAKHEGFRKQSANLKFNGFFELYCQNKIIDIRDLLRKIEKMFDNLNSEEFASLFTIYCVYNFSVDEASRLEGYEKIVEKYQDKIKECRIQYLVMSIFLDGTPSWTTAEQQKCLDKYYNEKFKRNNIILPKLLEIMILCKIANENLREGNQDKYFEYLEKAKYESINNIDKYNYLKELEGENEIDLKKLGFS